MSVRRAIDFVKRHRVSLSELAILFASMLVVTYIAYSVDLFWDEGQLTPHQAVIELDEALLLGGLLVLGLLVFAIRRHLDQRREIRRRIAAEQQVRRLAFQDPLTGLANRRQFDEALKAAVDSPPRSTAMHALLLLDLNGFKRVNDVHGHAIGDELLMIVAQRLLSAVREGDLLARFGGDEFAVLAQHLLGTEAATSLARRLVAALEQPITTGRVSHQIGVGIGIVLIPQDATSPQEAVRRADIALYRAKAERRSAFRYFEEPMDRQIAERDRLETLLREAVTHDLIKATFQPQWDLKTGRVIGFEVQPRWQIPDLGNLPPARFLPIAEEVGLIHQLASCLLEQACRAAAHWPPQISLAIDIYPGQLKDPELPQRILQTLAQHGMPTSRLELEITESALVQDVEAARQIVEPLRSAGARITLDNFGTGYSSLYHLQSIKLDKVKIDRSFAEQWCTSEQKSRVFAALAGLGHGLGLKVAAEGLPGAPSMQSLLESGCEQGQGSWLGDAVSATETLQLLSLESPKDPATRPMPVQATA